MEPEKVKCILLADRHQGLVEGVRSLLETTFQAVVMVANEASLFERARRLRPTLAVVDLSFRAVIAFSAEDLPLSLSGS